MPKRRLIPVLLVLCAFAASAATAAAKPHVLHFKGKTKEGTKISFVLDGHWVDQLQTILPETCISVQGGTPKVDLFVWSIPYKYSVGYQAKVKYGSPTAYYTITTHRHGNRVSGNRVSGKLSVNYSLLGDDGFGDYIIWHCLGTGNFNLVGR